MSAASLKWKNYSKTEKNKSQSGSEIAVFPSNMGGLLLWILHGWSLLYTRGCNILRMVCAWFVLTFGQCLSDYQGQPVATRWLRTQTLSTTST